MPVSQKVENRTATWTSMFPADIKTAQTSLLFLKKLFAVGVSNVMYLRAIFPEFAFLDRNLEGLNLKILRDDSTCSGAGQVCKWVRGCFDALEKKFLKKAVLVIFSDPKNTNNILESYEFKFHYYDDIDAVTMDIDRSHKTDNNEMSTNQLFNSDRIKTAPNMNVTQEEVQASTTRLLRTLLIASQTLGSLPDDVMMTMKLFYYDDVVPEEYEPPGFKQAEFTRFIYNDEIVELKIGEVHTKFNGMRMMISSEKSLYQEKSNTSNTSSNLDVSRTTRSPATAIPAPKAESSLTSNERSARSTRSSAVTHDNSGIGAPNPPEGVVRCLCGREDDLGIMILCAVCDSWQHAVCVGVVDENDAPAEHYCDQCVSEMPVDARRALPDNAFDRTLLEKTTTEAKRSLCLIRAVLHYINSNELNSVSAARISSDLGIPAQQATAVLSILSSQSAFTNRRQRTNRTPSASKEVNRIKVAQQLIPKYFNRRSVDLADSDVDMEESEPSTNKKCDEKSVDVEEQQLSSMITDMNLRGRSSHGRKKRGAAGSSVASFTPRSSPSDCSRVAKKKRISEVTTPIPV